MFIVGDPSLRYGEIVFVIDAAKGAGVEKVGIVTMGCQRSRRHRAARQNGGQLTDCRLQIEDWRGRFPDGGPACFIFRPRLMRSVTTPTLSTPAPPAGLGPAYVKTGRPVSRAALPNLQSAVFSLQSLAFAGLLALLGVDDPVAEPVGFLDEPLLLAKVLGDVGLHAEEDVFVVSPPCSRG